MNAREASLKLFLGVISIINITKTMEKPEASSLKHKREVEAESQKRKIRKIEVRTLLSLPPELIDGIVKTMLPEPTMPMGQIVEALENVLSLVGTCKEELLWVRRTTTHHLAKKLEDYTEVTNYKQENLLTCAIKQKKWQVALLLIDAGFSIEKLDVHNRNMLFAWSISNGYDVLAKHLLDLPLQAGVKERTNSVNLLFSAGYSKEEIEQSTNSQLIVQVIQNNQADLADALDSNYFSDVLEVKQMVALEDKKTKQNLLQWAIINRYEACVKLLLENGVAIDKASITGVTPIHCAVLSGSLLLVQLLLDGGANVNSKTKLGITPLLLAAIHGHAEIVNFLLVRGADVNEKAYAGLTPFAGATLADNESAAYSNIKADLLTFGADKTDLERVDKIHCLRWAYTKLLFPLVPGLLKAGADCNYKFDKGATIFHFAAIVGHTRLMKLLLEHNGDCTIQDNFGQTPLICAIYHGHWEVARLLLDYYINVNSVTYDGRTALAGAVDKENVEMVELLLKAGADSNSGLALSVPLSQAIKKDNVKITELLLKHNADVSKNVMNVTFLRQAITGDSSIELIKLLLEYKADVNLACMPDGSTLLLYVINHCFVFRDSAAVIKLLIDYGARVDQANQVASGAITPLIAAVKRDALGVVSILLEHGANPHLVTSSNQTALDIAIEKGNKRIIKLLKKSIERHGRQGL